MLFTQRRVAANGEFSYKETSQYRKEIADVEGHDRQHAANR